MRTEPLDEATLADAWVASDGSIVDPARCPSTDRIWDVARGATDVPVVQDILDHTLTCSDCALALRTAVELHAASGLSSKPERKSFWAWLGATALRPEAAFAYLLLLAISFPVLRWLQPQAPRPDAPVAVVSGARVIGLESASVARGGDAPKPAVVDAAGADSIVLRLFVDREDLAAGVPLIVTLSSGDRVLAAPKLPADAVGENGTLDVTLDVRAVPRNLPLAITVTSGAQSVFERSFVLRGR